MSQIFNLGLSFHFMLFRKGGGTKDFTLFQGDMIIPVHWIFGVFVYSISPLFLPE